MLDPTNPPPRFISSRSTGLDDEADDGCDCFGILFGLTISLGLMIASLLIARIF